MKFDTKSKLLTNFRTYSVTDRPPARIMDSVCADNLNNAESNNNAMETNNLGETTTTTTDAVNAEQPQTYDDLFPSLPTAPPGKGRSGPPIGDWSKKPMLSSSTVTSLFHIPVEERKDQASGHFGGGSTEDSSKLVKTVMEKTGAKIEMSSNKDQSLTFLIRGKQETVLKVIFKVFTIEYFPVFSAILSILVLMNKYLINCWSIFLIFDQLWPIFHLKITILQFLGRFYLKTFDFTQIVMRLLAILDRLWPISSNFIHISHAYFFLNFKFSQKVPIWIHDFIGFQ